jgi:IS30 family transposase
MSHITKEQRYTIEALLKQGKKQCEIARVLGKCPSVVSRERRRNQDLRSGEYRSELATKKYQERHRKKPKKKKLTVEMKQVIFELLSKKYSPEQICGRLKLEGKEWVSHETIYQYIWMDKGQKGKLYKNLRSRGKPYKKRGLQKDKRGHIIGRRDIVERPKAVEEKERIGDLEIDTVIGKDHRGALVTINDRVTKMVKIRLVKSKEAEVVKQATIEALREWTHIKTITSDNGKEFALHREIAMELNIDFYFAKPYHSWQRGANENTNGLIRQYIPKKTDFTYLTDYFIQKIETDLNNRPRKKLNYLTPNEVFLQLLSQTG